MRGPAVARELARAPIQKLREAEEALVVSMLSVWDFDQWGFPAVVRLPETDFRGIVSWRALFTLRSDIIGLARHSTPLGVRPKVLVWAGDRLHIRVPSNVRDSVLARYQIAKVGQ